MHPPRVPHRGLGEPEGAGYATAARLQEPVLVGVRRGRGTRGHAQLGEDVAHVPVDRLLGQDQVGVGIRPRALSASLAAARKLLVPAHGALASLLAPGPRAARGGPRPAPRPYAGPSATAAPTGLESGGPRGLSHAHRSRPDRRGAAATCRE